MQGKARQRRYLPPLLRAFAPTRLTEELHAYPLFQVLRDLHHQTSLQSGRLGAARGRVASGRRIAVRYGQFHGQRQLNADRLLLEDQDLDSFQRFGEVLDLFRQILDRKVMLFESAQIEEMQVAWIAIDELGWVA